MITAVAVVVVAASAGLEATYLISINRVVYYLPQCKSRATAMDLTRLISRSLALLKHNVVS